MPGIILNPPTEPHLFQHLEVEHRALMKALRLKQLSFFDQLRLPPFQLLPNRFDGALQRRARHHVM